VSERRAVRQKADPNAKRPTVKDVYMPAWARLRRLAAFERFAGHPEAYADLSRLARCVRNEMTE
jgi:hypothetical protein